MMLAVYGPTVTGKTNLAIKLAKKFDGQIISCDSRQIYKGMDIGTGKVSPNSKIEKNDEFWMVDNIKIYGFDLINPGKTYSAAQFASYCKKKSKIIISEKNLPIITGGSGFYLKAAIAGIKSMGIKPNKTLRSELEKLTKYELYQKLLLANPQRARSMNDSDRQNPRRLIRAIEISLSNRKLTNNQLPIANNLIIGLTAPNDFLFKKADAWLKERLQLGLIEEVKKLVRSTGYQWLDSLGLEYRWISRYLKGDVSHDMAISRLKGDIHNLIRKQKTWLSQFGEISIFDITKKGWELELENVIGNSTVAQQAILGYTQS